MDHLIDLGTKDRSFAVYELLKHEIAMNSVAFASSFFRTQDYYQRWYEYLKLVSCGNAGREKEALAALSKRIELGIEDPQRFVRELHKQMGNKKLWENPLWIHLISSLNLDPEK